MSIKSSTLHKKIKKVKKEIKESDPNIKLILEIEELKTKNTDLSVKIVELTVKVNRVMNRLGL